MAVSFKYWDDCVDPDDMEAMWMDPEVRNEWIDAGETKGQKVHLSRDPDGQPFLTQTEMRVRLVERLQHLSCFGIIVRRHFISQIDPEMICAIAELESDRQPLAMRYNRKTKNNTMGIMQMLPKNAEWLVNEMGYRAYEVEGNPTLLYRPFVNVYFGAAFLKWLSHFDQKERSEEFVVRAYKGGTKKATSKSTLEYWKRYLSVKQSLPSRRQVFESVPTIDDASVPAARVSRKPVRDTYTYWDSRASPEDMEELWKHPDVYKEWTKSGERRGKVRFSHDAEKRPYLSRVEVKAVAGIILSKFFSSKAIRPTFLAALAEVISMRFVNGVGPHTGLMGIDYPKALWLYQDVGYKAYRIESVEDLRKPFISMYFGASYLSWLSGYEGRERTPQFVIQAYLARPENVNLQETGPLWTKFQEALSYYEDTKEQGSCSIL